MRYIDEFRDSKVATALSKKIHQQMAHITSTYKLMEFCGGHTHVIHRYAFADILPPTIELIHGPGCPVCVLPIARIDQAIALAEQHNVILCSYADMIRVPGSNQHSLLKAKANGATVKMIYSVDDALKIAQDNPQRQVVFFAIGFETTTPPTAVAIRQAKQLGLKNFSVFCNHVLTPVAMSALLDQHDNAKPVQLDGFIGPAHVSVIIGSDAYLQVANKYRKPIVIAGFEPLDVLQSISMLIDMVQAQEYGIKNQYTRAVTPAGNRKAQQLIQEVFEIRDNFEWRGLGDISTSAMKIHANYADFDAEQRFVLPQVKGLEHKSCLCAAILRGENKPQDCKLFGLACTPENPLGSCMVSSEGACAASYAYDRRAQKIAAPKDKRVICP
ncbi:MAG: hydrogenase formation protein HypD [Pseudomonadota bacterium]